MSNTPKHYLMPESIIEEKFQDYLAAKEKGNTKTMQEISKTLQIMIMNNAFVDYVWERNDDYLYQTKIFETRFWLYRNGNQLREITSPERKEDGELGFWEEGELNEDPDNEYENYKLAINGRREKFVDAKNLVLNKKLKNHSRKNYKNNEDYYEETIPQDYYPKEYQKYYEADKIKILDNGFFKEEQSDASSVIQMPYRLFCSVGELGAAIGLINNNSYSSLVVTHTPVYYCKNEDKEKLQQELQKYVLEEDVIVEYVDEKVFSSGLYIESLEGGNVRKYKKERAFVELYKAFLGEMQPQKITDEFISEFAYSIAKKDGYPDTKEIYDMATLYYEDNIAEFIKNIAICAYASATRQQWQDGLREELISELRGGITPENMKELIVAAMKNESTDLVAKLCIIIYSEKTNGRNIKNETLGMIKQEYSDYYADISKIATIAYYERS